MPKVKSIKKASAKNKATAKNIGKINSPALDRANAAVARLQKEAKAALKKVAIARNKATATKKAATKSKTAANKKAAVAAQISFRKVAAKAASINAKIRTARAKAKAIETVNLAKARKNAEKAKISADLERAVDAFIAKWKRKRAIAGAAQAAKRARKAALKARIAAKEAALKEKIVAKKVAAKAKVAARKASKGKL